MKTLRLILITILCVTGFSTMQAAPVDTGTARSAAYRFMLTRPGFSALRPEEVRLAFTSAQLDGSNENGFYAFSVGDHGFVIVAADNRSTPVLAYSTTSALTPDDMPPVTRELLHGYHSTVSQQLGHEATCPEKAEQWNALLDGQHVKMAKSANTVEPLIKTTWNQSPYYNKFCPIDTTTYMQSVTGCVATAMAQIIRYWEWPKNGYGVCAYTHYMFGYLQTDFSKTNYDFQKMPVALSKNSDTDEVNAVAKLMSDCGIGVAMGYSPFGSGAWVLETAGGEYSAEYVMRHYYGYVRTDGTYKDRNPSVWQKRVKNDLDNGCPLLFSATKPSEGGHAFICDGYDDKGLFHFNWGWGGKHDGYYLMDSAYGFNVYQAAIFGLMPPTKLDSYNIVLFSNILPSSDTIACDEPFEVRVAVQNNGNKPFFGDFRLVLQNSQTSENVEVFDTISYLNDPLAAESHTQNPFVFHGRLSNLLTNNYNLRLQYRDTNADEWLNVNEIGNFSNLRSIRFEGGSSSTQIDKITDVTTFTAHIEASLQKACSETVTMKAIQYRQSGTSSFSTVKDTSSGDSIRVNLTNLKHDTPYEVQSYIMVKSGGTFKTYTSELKSFRTLLSDAVPNTGKQNVRIAPNPSHGTVSIATEGKKFQLEIRNVTGQCLHRQTLNGNQTEINLENLPKGLYFFILENGTEKIIDKIVLE